MKTTFSRASLREQSRSRDKQGWPQHWRKARPQSVCLVNARTQRNSTFKGDSRKDGISALPGDGCQRGAIDRSYPSVLERRTGFHFEIERATPGWPREQTFIRCVIIAVILLHVGLAVIAIY